MSPSHRLKLRIASVLSTLPGGGRLLGMLRRLYRAARGRSGPAALTAPPPAAAEGPQRPPRLWVVLPEGDAAPLSARLSTISPQIIVAAEAEAAPAAGDLVHAPGSAAACLSADALRMALLTLAHRPLDGVVVSAALDDGGDTVSAASVAAALVLTAATWTAWRADGALPPDFRGRLLRLPPPAPGQEMRSLPLSAFGALRRDGLHDLLGPQARPLPAARGLDGALFTALADDDPRPVVWVMPAVLAVGGVERNTIEIMAQLAGDYRFVMITTEPLHAAHGSLHHQLPGRAEAVFDLGEAAPLPEHMALIDLIGRSHRPDLIWICNGSLWLVANAGALRARFPAAPIIDQQVYDTEVGWIEHFDNPDIRAFDRFIAINSKIRDTFQGRYRLPAARIDLIYPVMDGRRFGLVDLSADEVAERRRAFGLPDHGPVFALVGRLAEQKRPLDFLDLARRVRERHPEAVFVLVGNGPLAEAVEAKRATLPPGTVHRIPFCDDMSRLYPVFSAVVLVSAFEGLPIVTLEALSMGVPVLSTDVGDVRLVVEDYGVGRVADDAIGRPARMAEAFEGFYADLPVLTAQARTAAPLIRERFSATTVAAQYRACWQEALRQRTAARSVPPAPPQDPLQERTPG